MRSTRGGVRLARVALAMVGSAALFGSPAAPGAAPLAGQGYSEADSLEILEDMRELQRDFERYRQSRIPVHREREDARCDEEIGRICIWFGGEDETDFPGELPEVARARGELISKLTIASERIADPWILGQLVRYLVEARNHREAERVATDCRLAATWWCSALLGYSLHVRTEHVAAETAFRGALAEMPPEELEAWLEPRYILTDEGHEALHSDDPDEAMRRWELFWRLSDPLFLFQGNDRFTDHLARLVEARNHTAAEHPQGMSWERDMEETLIRYGRIIGWSRSHDPRRAFSRHGLQDTRRVVGHHHPKSRGYLFPEEFLASPSEIPPESWITAPREARTWYAPPYAPEIRGLETQVGRFRRGDEMLVVGAYRPTLEARDGRAVAAFGHDDGIRGEVHTALFLVPEEGENTFVVQGDEPEGVLSLRAWPGNYVSSLEVVDQRGRQAWRARQGVRQRPLVEGLVDVSDLLILKEGSRLPGTLEDAIPDVRPGVRVRAGERFALVWEVYGLRVLEQVQVTIGFTPGLPGFLEDVGEFVGEIEPDQPVEITFEDTGPDQVQTVFRSIELELPDLEPGEYTLHLRLDLFGRSPIYSSRPILVER